MRAVVRHAYEHVPFYRTLWDEAGIRPEAVRTLEDLPRLPIVTRPQIQRAGREALARGTDLAACRRTSTTGHSGQPLEVVLSDAEVRTRLLVEFRTLIRMGLRPRDRLVILGPATGRGPHWHERLGLFRTHVIVIGTPLEEQIRLLERYQPTVLWAYPGCLHAVLHRLDYRLSRIVRPRLLITSSAVLPEHLRKRLEDDLGCPILNSYASMETGRIAAECRERNGLHVNADQLIVECLPDPPVPSGAATTVVTTLTARTMPMIRYRLGDIASLMPGRCPCGCIFPRITAPAGRQDDLVRLPSGRVQASWRLQAVIRRFPEIDQYRVVQDGRAHITIRVCVRKPWPEERCRRLGAAVREALEEDFDVEVRLTEFMPARNGKFRDFEYAVRD